MTNKTEPAELLPCPFCGGAAARYFDGDYVVVCSRTNDCHIHPSCDGYNAEEAETAWNTRHHPEPDVDVVEAVARAISPEVFACPRINLNKPVYDRAYDRARAAISVLSTPSVKPVAWMYEYPGATQSIRQERLPYNTTWTETPLYATPQPTPAHVQVTEAESKALHGAMLASMDSVQTPAQVRAEALRDAAKIAEGHLDHNDNTFAEGWNVAARSIQNGILALIGDKP